MTNDIYILNQSLVLQGVVDNYESFIIHMVHGDSSYIQIVLDTEANNADKLVKGNIIYSPDQLNCPCIITETPTSFSGEGRTKTVIAFDVFWWFKKRLANVTTSDVTYSGQTVEYIIKDLLTNNLASDRTVTYFTIASGTSLGSTIDLTVKQLPLYDVIVGLLSIDSLGLKGTFNGTSIEIDVYAGTDRSEDNGVNSAVIFSLDYNNIKEGETVSSNTFTTNYAYVLGVDGSGNRIIQEVGTATGNDRFETVVDGGDVSDTGELTDIGNAALQPLEEGASYSTQALTGSFIYDVNYSLGDIVTVVGQDLRVTEVEIVREEGSAFQVYLTFGQAQKEASDQITELNTRVSKLEAKISSGGGGSGTVTSVAISGNDGIEVDSGSPITSSGTIALGINKTSLLTHINVEDGATANTKATGAELDTGTDDVKFATAKALKDSHNVPSVAPGTSGNVLTSDGTDWTSAAPSGGGDVALPYIKYKAIGGSL